MPKTLINKMREGKIVPTKSKIPKTPKQKRMFVRAEGIAAKAAGTFSEKNIPFGLAVKIYKDEEKADKVAKAKDVKKTKVSKAVKKYKRG